MKGRRTTKSFLENFDFKSTPKKRQLRSGKKNSTSGKKKCLADFYKFSPEIISGRKKD